MRWIAADAKLQRQGFRDVSAVRDKEVTQIFLFEILRQYWRLREIAGWGQ